MNRNRTTKELRAIHAKGEAKRGYKAPAKPGASKPSAHQHGDYTLHKLVVVRHGQRRTLYFFAKSKPKRGVPARLPPGREVGVNRRTGMPYLYRVTASQEDAIAAQET